MEYVYSALLLHSAGQPINEDNVKKVMETAGVKVDSARVKALVASLEGVNIEEAIKSAAPVAVAAAPAAGGAKPAEAAGKKKEEKKEEDDSKKEDDAASGLAALFG